MLWVTIRMRNSDKVLESPRIDRPEMTFYPPNFLFKDFVPEPRLKFALTQRCSSYTHSFLSST